MRLILSCFRVCLALLALLAVRSSAQEAADSHLREVAVTDYHAESDHAVHVACVSLQKEADCDAKGGDDCDSKGGCECECSCYCFGPDEACTLQSLICHDPCSPHKMGGWLAVGYHSDEVPLSFNRNDLLSFGDFASLETNQAWFYAEKEADGECGCDWGYRMDILYGTDAQKTQAFGNPVNSNGNQTGWDTTWDHGLYGWALPQAYLEVATGNLSVIAGHFFTLVGYEVVSAPDNFFYTHALTMFNSEPFTHTGAVATYTVNSNWEVYAGWTAGWDTGFDQNNGGSNWLGGAKWSPAENLSVIYISTAGNFGARGKDAYSHSIVIDWEVSDKLNYIIQSDYVDIDTPVTAAQAGVANHQVGINQYLIYRLNECWGVGGRVEWWRSDGVSYNEATIGLNYKPHANLVIRPEYRYDWTSARSAATRSAPTFLYPAGVNDVSTFSIDAILTF